MKVLISFTLFVTCIWIISSAVLLGRKNTEELQATNFVKVETGFKKDLANAD